jgi:hypothetical protein
MRRFYVTYTADFAQCFYKQRYALKIMLHIDIRLGRMLSFDNMNDPPAAFCTVVTLAGERTTTTVAANAWRTIAFLAVGSCSGRGRNAFNVLFSLARVP